MSDPWVPITGPKGATGPHQAYPSLPFRRFCGTGNENQGDSSGFNFVTGYRNYSPLTDGGADRGHCRLQAYRNTQGRVTYQGLVYAQSPDVPPYYVFYLPWDMLPNPYQPVTCTFGSTSGQRARYDILNGPGGLLQYMYRNGGQAPGAGQWVQVHFSIQTYVPVAWVDFGCKVLSMVDNTAITGTLDYTVAPGQMSGYTSRGAYTATIPAQVTVRLGYTAVAAYYPFFYYDLVNQQFGQRLLTTTALGAVWRDPNSWMSLADEGKVVLAVYSSTGLLDRRFFMRGPSDDLRQVSQ